MYQANENVTQTQEDFEGLIKIFNESVCDLASGNEDPTEYDLTKEYSVNRVCIWNKTWTLYKPVKILQKNNKVALVDFVNLTQEESIKVGLVGHIFRLEDLTPLEMTK